MKENKITQNKVKILIILMIPIIIIGIFLAVQTGVKSQRLLYEEHDKHLAELVYTMDHNITTVLNRSRNIFSTTVSSKEFIDAEKNYVLHQDDTDIDEQLSHIEDILSDYSAGMLVKSGSDFVKASGQLDASSYEILPDTGKDDVWFIRNNNTGRRYIAISYRSKTFDYVYYILMDYSKFFKRIVTETIYEEHWFVVYNDGSGYAIHNDFVEPTLYTFTKEEMMARDDGYTKIAIMEDSNTAGPISYTYVDSDGKKQAIRLNVLPSGSSENGSFAIASAVYNAKIMSPNRWTTVKIFLSAILVVLGITVFIYLLSYSRRREKELSDKLQNLAIEKAISEELLREQEALAHHQKLETIGTLTAGIAHGFNNLLSPILGNSLLILEKTRVSDEDTFNDALEIYEASVRAKTLVKSISKLSRKESASQMKPLSANKLLQDTLVMSESTIPKTIKVIEDYKSDEMVFGDETQLINIFINLVINAVQEIGDKVGQITLSTDSDEEYVYISVSDSGKGIKEELKEKIFDPFFTTKESGKGTGLGLAISKKTAANHSGDIYVENLETGGAKFTVKLPIYREK